MADLPNNPSCSLSGTKYCALLNMHACERCTVRESTELDAIKKDVDVYETLLPEGGVARLFESRTCQFCKGEPKGRRAGYAILDMAHPEPKRVQKFLLGKRRLAIGTMIPVQMSVCRACRRRFLLMDYLPMVVPVLFGAVGLLLLATGPVSEAAMGWNPIAPFALWLGITVVGWLIGKLLSRRARIAGEKTMVTDVLKHPVIAEMLEKGWQPITRRSESRLLFSKSRLAKGLGTAPDDGIVSESAEERLELPENTEND